ncbi:hypothetical protein GQ457_14G014070 [Hibiscus cannabinus]
MSLFNKTGKLQSSYDWSLGLLQQYRPLDIRPERTVDLDFLMSDVYNFDFFDLFANWGWLDYLIISNTYYPLLIRAFYANGILVHAPNNREVVVAIRSFLMGREFEITPDSIADHLGVSLSVPHGEEEPHNIPTFRNGRPTHLDIEERLFLLITTCFFRPSGGRATRMHECDYWWLRCYRDRTRPNITQIIFLTLVKIVNNPPSFSLPYGCVLSHIFRIIGIDTSLDRAMKNKSKIDIKTCHKEQCFFDETVDWLHGGKEEDDDDEAHIGDVLGKEIPTPFHEDAPVAHAPAPMYMEFMYQTMIARFDNMSTRFDSLDA